MDVDRLIMKYRRLSLREIVKYRKETGDGNGRFEFEFDPDDFS